MRVLTGIVLVALLLVAGKGQAKENRFTFYAGGGAAVTLGTLGHQSNAGYVGTAGIGLRPSPVSSPELEIVLRFQYAKFPNALLAASDYEYMLGGIDFKLNRLLAHRTNTYAVAGFGGSRLADGVYEKAPYLTLGIGLESKWLFLEVRAVAVFGEQVKTSTFLPIVIGLRF